MATKNNISSKLGIVITLLLVLVAIPSVVANVDWYSAHGDSTNTGRADINLLTLFDNDTNIPNERVLNYGKYTPLIGDFDDDGDNEVYMSSGTSIYMLDEVNGAFKAIYALNMGAAEDGQAWAGYVDNNNNDTKIIAMYNNLIYTLKWNGSDIVQEGSYNTTLNINSGVTCADEIESGTGFRCYTNDAVDQLIIYNPNAYTGLNYTIAGIDFETTSYDETKYSPIVSDIDNDNILEYVTTYDLGGSNRNGLIALQVGNSSGASDWTFSSGVANTYIKGYLAYDFDEVGDEEICITYVTISGTFQEDGIVRCFDGDGTSIFSSTVADDQSSSGTQGYIANPVVADIDGDGTSELCVVNHIAGSIQEREVNCYDGSTGSFTLTENLRESSQTWGIDFSTTASQSHLYAARLDGLGRDVLFIEDYAFYLATTTYSGIYNLLGFLIPWSVSSDEFQYYEWTFDTDANVMSSFGDVNDDGLLDAISIDYGSTQLSYLTSSIVNSPPTLNNTQFDYGGYGSTPSYLNPICVNTSVNFNAVEDTNYENDFSTDQERLVTNCGYTTSGAVNNDPTVDRVNGNYTGTNPIYSCYYNTTGIYPVTIYIQDEENSADFNSYNTQTISINVINGIAGVECNFAGVSAGSSTLSKSTVSNDALDQSVEDTFGILTGTSTTMKLIVGFAIVIGLLISTAQIVNNPFVILSVGILGTSMLTFIGLLPKWIIVFIIFSLVVATAAKMAFGRHAGAD